MHVTYMHEFANKKIKDEMLTRQSLQDQFHFHQNLQEFNKMNNQIAVPESLKSTNHIRSH